MESVSVEFAGIIDIDRDREVVDPVNGVLCLGFGLPWFGERDRIEIGIQNT